MSTVGQVFFYSIIGGLVAMVGGVVLIARKSWADRFSRYATPFAAGAMLAAAFMDLLPEALEGEAEPHNAMLFALLGLVFFFILETVIHWSHKHGSDEEHDSHDGHDNHDEHGSSESHTSPTSPTSPIIPMIVIGDTIHNFLDGIAIAAGFLVSPASGIVVTLAVAAHEIPHEIGDFGLMLDNGVTRGRVLLINVVSQMAAPLAAMIFFLWGNASDITLTPMLAVVAGFFIYISAADIIPTIHEGHDKYLVLRKSISLIVGLILVSLLITTFHGLIDTEVINSGFRV